MVVLVSVFYGCSSPPVTQEIPLRQPEVMERNPRVQFNYARFFHWNQKSLVSIHYRNSGRKHAYRVVTDLKVFLGANNVPLQRDSLEVEPTLAPNAHRELQGILPDAFFEKVIDGKEKLTMEFTASYYNEQGIQFVARSSWQFSKTTLEPFLLEDQRNEGVVPSPNHEGNRHNPVDSREEQLDVLPESPSR